VRAAPEAQTFRVATSGSDTSSCGSTSAPCQSIQYAVNRAASGDTILVAGGTYTYKASVDTCSFLTTRAVVCFVDKHLTIRGGFSTSNWITPDPIANPTIIDGGNSRRGVAIIAYNSTASLTMEGFTIQNGLAQGTSSGDDFYTFAFGGGMWAQNSAVTLRDVIFRNNRAQGGNTSGQYGGAGSGGGLAIQSTKNGVVSVLERVVFENNRAVGGSGVRRGGLAVGGGLYTYQAAINGTDIQITNNLAQAGSSSGSGVDNILGLRADAIGGGASFQIGSTITLERLTVSDNSAIGGNAGTGSGSVGGGAYGGALHAERSQLTLRDVVMNNNTARGGNSATGGLAFGGGLMTDATYANLDRVSVMHNAAISGGSLTGGSAGAPGGGGAYITTFTGTGYSAQVVNSIFADNRVEVGTPGSDAGGGGAGLVIQGMTVDVIHGTFVSNYFVGGLISGQAILVQGTQGSGGTPATANIKNVIIADHKNTATSNTSALTVAANSTARLTRGIFSGNTNDTNINGRPFAPGTITGLETMLSVADVRFVAPGAPYWDYHLGAGSPAIDQGVDQGVGFDIDGQLRPINGTVDIGADEAGLAGRPPNSFFLPIVRR